MCRSLDRHPWWTGQAETVSRVAAKASVLCRGVAKLVKASDFDSDMRGFESFLPCQIFCARLPRLRLRARPCCSTPCCSPATPTPGWRRRSPRPGRRTGQGQGRTLLRRRSRRSRSTRTCVRVTCSCPVHLRTDQRKPDGAADHGRCPEARLGPPHHRRHPLLRLRPPGPQAALAPACRSAPRWSPTCSKPRASTAC